jgi:hypothetical protein
MSENNKTEHESRGTNHSNHRGDDLSDEQLPAKTSVSSHHEAVKDAGRHPVIPKEIEYDDVAEGLDNALHVEDGDRMVGILERNECPICGRKGTLSLGETFGGRWVVRNPRDGFNWTLKELEEDGYRPINCIGRDESRRNVFLVGVACPDAVEAWRDWQDDRDEIRSFQRNALKLAEYPDRLTGGFRDSHKPSRQIDVPLHHEYDHGDLLAAIYHCLGCTGYDPRDLMGRTHVTKKQLAVLLTRLWSLDIDPSRDISAKEWVEVERFGNKHGNVQWKVPSWAGTEELTAMSRYKRGTYDGVMVEDNWFEEANHNV